MPLSPVAQATYHVHSLISSPSPIAISGLIVDRVYVANCIVNEKKRKNTMALRHFERNKKGAKEKPFSLFRTANMAAIT